MQSLLLFTYYNLLHIEYIYTTLVRKSCAKCALYVHSKFVVAGGETHQMTRDESETNQRLECEIIRFSKFIVYDY